LNYATPKKEKLRSGTRNGKTEQRISPACPNHSFWWRASFDAWPLGQDELTPNEESWLREIGDQLRANADNLGEFTLADFAYPPFTLNGRRNAGNPGVRG